MSDLTDKMRTCAAFIKARQNDAPMPTEHLLDDAAELLEQAAKLLDDAIVILGEPAKPIEPARGELWTLLEQFKPEPPAPQLGPDSGKLTHAGPPLTLNEPGSPVPPKLQATWMTGADGLPAVPHPQGGRRPPRVCPACDSHANKTVLKRRDGVYLGCPVCGQEWKYQP